MSVALYRPGDTHIIRKIRCEMAIFPPKNFRQQLENGWFMSPEECYPGKFMKEVEKPEKQKIFKPPMPSQTNTISKPKRTEPKRA